MNLKAPMEPMASGTGRSFRWMPILAGAWIAVWGTSAAELSGLLLQDRESASVQTWVLQGVRKVFTTIPFEPARPEDPGWRVAATADMNGDGKPDLIWQHEEGLLAVWYMNGPELIAAALLNPSHPGDRLWRVAGAGDFDRDGKVDLLFQYQNEQGMLAVWLMDGVQMVQSVLLNPSYIGPGWRVKAVADFNQDGNLDIAVQHADQWIAVWHLNGAELVSNAFFNPQIIPAGWEIRGAADLNRDGHPDLVVEHAAGLAAVWLLRGNTRIDSPELDPNVLEPGFRIVGLGDFSQRAAPDSDYDGRTDPEEALEGTNPREAQSAARTRLGYWRFETADLAGEQRQVPAERANAARVPSFDGGGLRVSGPFLSVIRYRDTEVRSGANINLRNGTVRFQFRPDWSSTDLGGRGPGSFARLIEVGQWTPDARRGWWSLYVNPEGTRLTFATQTNGAEQVLLHVPARFVSNLWHEIVLSYSPEGSALYLVGTKLGSGGGIRFYPGPEVRAQGFRIGSDIQGGQWAEGAFDEFETFNYPLGDLDVYQHNNAITATTVLHPPRVDLRWRFSPNQSTTLQRRSLDSDGWETLTSGTAWSFSDTNTMLIPGNRYEYRLLPHGVNIWTGGIVVGMQSVSPDYRGRVLLLVDEALSGSLGSELEQVTLDLIGDGWRVARFNVPRHDDEVWSRNVARIARIKSLIAGEYAQDPVGTRAVFLIGHVTIPYSGAVSPDSHTAGGTGPDHFGAWPADGYYGDIDGLWTDATVNYVNRDLPDQTNLPGDGKFDQLRFPTNATGVAAIEVAVGRVDFARLPAFGAAEPSRDELALLKQYFAKLHRYRHRHRQSTAPGRLVANSYFGSGEDQIIFTTAQGVGTRLFGTEPGRILQADIFADRIPALLGIQGGYGAPDRITVAGLSNNVHTVADLTDPTNEPPVMFYVLKGSYFGDWNMTNNFLRATLATPKYGLAAVWTRGTQWRFDTLSLGGTLGEAFLRTMNDTTQEFPVLYTYLALMGDPTLRAQPIAPPTQLTGGVNLDGNVELFWEPSPEPDALYYVYRAGSWDEPFMRLTFDPVRVPEFIDPEPIEGPRVYQVRALKVVPSGSGSYADLSQAAFLSIE